MHTIGCLTCHQSIGQTRGCCYRCYQKHLAAVRKGATTWAALVAEGKALAVDRGQRQRFMNPIGSPLRFGDEA